MEDDGWTNAREVAKESAVSRRLTFSDAHAGPVGGTTDVAAPTAAVSRDEKMSVLAKSVLALARASKERLDRAMMSGKMDVHNTSSLSPSVSVRVQAQPRLLVGGLLQSHQLHGLQWLVAGRSTDVGSILADGACKCWRASRTHKRPSPPRVQTWGWARRYK